MYQGTREQWHGWELDKPPLDTSVELQSNRLAFRDTYLSRLFYGLQNRIATASCSGNSSDSC
jgi:hypothetical protein